MAVPAPFKRVLLGFHYSVCSRESIEEATEIARFLKIGLHGVLIRDATLESVLRQPGLREFQLLKTRWMPIEPVLFEKEAQASVNILRRLVTEVAQSAQVTWHFETVEAEVSSAIGTLSGPGDIILLPEPGRGVETICEPFNQLYRTAMASSAAVLIVPRRGLRSRGPVLAVSAGEDDAGVAAARQISSAAGRELIITRRKSLEIARSAGALPAFGESMVVLSRAGKGVDLSTDWIEIVRSRKVPVLIVRSEIS